MVNFLGDASTNDFMDSSFTIDKVTVTARTRAMVPSTQWNLLKILKPIHGLDVETELANILSTELLAEINREVVRTIYTTAQKGAEVNVTDCW